MPISAERFVRHVDACDNAEVPGGRVRLTLGGAPVGYVRAEDAPPAPLADVAAFDAYVAGRQRAGRFRVRTEMFDVRDELTGLVVATVDRGAVPLLGITAQGVHCNGLVRRADGLHLWVGRRAAHKRLEPGKLDHMVAGGVPAGHGTWDTLIKEGEEEANLPRALAITARPVGGLRYAMEHGEGLRRDRLHIFDVWLPEDFTPVPNDDEVEEFCLWRLEDVLARVAETDDFKFNVSLVLIDLFLRTGLIDTGTAEGRAVEEGMRRVRQGQGSALDPLGAAPPDPQPS